MHNGDVNRPERVWEYLRKRVTRIYPIYWFVCALVIPPYFLLPIRQVGYETEAGSVVGSLALVPMAHPPILPVAWTLQHEMLFYFLFAAIILAGRCGLALVVAWQLMVAVYNIFPFERAWPLDFLLNLHNLHFGIGIGMACAWLCLRFRVPAPRLIFWLGWRRLCRVGGGVRCPGLELRQPGSGPGMGGNDGGGPGRRLRPRDARDAARAALPGGTWSASYVLYLVHYPVELTVVKGFVVVMGSEGIALPLVLVAAVVTALAAAFAIHRVVERPMLQALRNLPRQFVRDGTAG